MSGKNQVRLAIAAAMAGAVSLAVAGAPDQAMAKSSKVKCYGIAKAGENHCADAAGTHSCAAQSTVDYDGGEWRIAKSVEACQEAGGSLEPFDGVNENQA